MLPPRQVRALKRVLRLVRALRLLERRGAGGPWRSRRGRLERQLRKAAKVGGLSWPELRE